MTRLHIVVYGHVQGIGYRWFAQLRATKLGLSGWVRNKTDGSVELEAEGPKEALEELARALRSDHPNARVDEIKTRTLAPQGGAKIFEIH